MGGEWIFDFLGDPSTIDVKKYQQELVKIQQRYQSDPELYEHAQWFLPTQSQSEPADNIFAKFTYKCERHEWHKGEPGVAESQNAWWILPWDPSKLQKGYNKLGNIHARCRPKHFVKQFITMQTHLALHFPEHFQVYLGDDIYGCGDRELYWGVKPKYLENFDSYLIIANSNKEWFLETI